MAERDVTRNGRGQIVSYAISGVSDSTEDSLKYGKVLLPTLNNGATKTEKLNRQSLEQHIDVTFSDDLLTPNASVTPEINMNETLTDLRLTSRGADNLNDAINDAVSGNSSGNGGNTSPSGPPGGGPFGGGSPRD